VKHRVIAINLVPVKIGRKLTSFLWQR